MLITITRTLLLYTFVVFSVRLMGKRQIGELQPSELVITILLSEIAAIPMQNNRIPLLNSFVAVLILVSLEVFSSFFAMKSSKFRKVTEGNAIYVIKEGKLLQKDLKKLRFTVDDLMEALRQKDIFDISDVEYAIVETNGSLSVLLKADKLTITPSDLGKKIKEKGIPCVIISDGKVVKDEFNLCNMTDKKLNYILEKENRKIENIMLMTINKSGDKIIIDKEQNK